MMRTLTAALAATVALALAPAASAITAPHPTPDSFSPRLVHTGTGPTGYQVTFRIDDPTATRMRIKGEWSFSSAADIAADPTNPNPRNGNTWQPGDFPLASPNAGSAPNWPVEDMVKDDATGVWSFTTALPSGVFTYAYYRDCAAPAPALTGCTPMADPSNPPWNTSGSVEATSQVYVPADPRFQTPDYSWQAVAPPGQRGTLTHVTYSSPGHLNPPDQNYLSVYTPPGYDPGRAVPYPVFYLIHGGGGNEMDWSTQGDLNNIMDNLIANGLVQPMVVVMPNNPTTPELLDDIIPFTAQHYHIDRSASGRALAGLSGGATAVQDILFHNTTSIGYYAVWSAPRGLPTAGEQNNPQLKQLLGLHVGVAIQDLGGLAQGNTTADQALLTAAGVPFVSYNVNGGHNWSYWRNALRDFLTRVAFRATTTTVHTDQTPAGVLLTATVMAATAEPATPTGSVQFKVDGQNYGTPRPLHDGVAEILIPAQDAGSAYGASYSGGQYYNISTTS
ncbi:MAG TPA: Ig-like domain repeat protein [Mycobacterium sp.]|nr:Ig-like domain repeat protein [Mycobacterium sp.]